MQFYDLTPTGFKQRYIGWKRLDLGCFQLIFDLLLVNFIVAFVILVLAPQRHSFFVICNHLRLIMQINVIFKRFFQSCICGCKDGCICSHRIFANIFSNIVFMQFVLKSNSIFAKILFDLVNYEKSTKFYIVCITA